MRQRRGGPRRRVVGLLLAAGLAVAGCTGDADGAGVAGGSTVVISPPSTLPVAADGDQIAADAIGADPGVATISAGDGVVVWVHDREPPSLHVDDPDNGTQIASWIRQGLVEGLFGIGPDLAMVPELLAGEPVVTANNSGTVDIAYELRSELRWSDGTALTANDVAYTHRIIVEGCLSDADGSIVDGASDGCIYRMANRVGYDLVTGITVADETHFTVHLTSYFPGWRQMYTEVFAEHAFGANADEVNDNLPHWQNPAGVLPSSGPLLLSQWVRGERIDLVTNPQYHGSVFPGVSETGPASVAGVQIAFVPEVGDRLAVMESGRAHLLVAGLDPAFTPLAGADGVRVASVAGGSYELLGMNLLNPHLRTAAVREAVAYAVDKRAVVERLYQPLLGDAVAADGLGNTYWLANQAGYEDHQSGYAGANLEASAAALAAAGYTQGADGVFVHPEAGRLTVRLVTTGGMALREAEAGILADQLIAAGFEVTVELLPGGRFYEQGPFSADAMAAAGSAGADGDPNRWDLAVFGWSSGPWPGGVSGLYRSGSSANPFGFANPQFDAAASECDAKTDDAERVGCYNALDVYATTVDNAADGLFVVPLSQRPPLVAEAGDLTGLGPVVDSPWGGPLPVIVTASL
ncbi:MAG: ABC transporter substrate-binding protein [Acidimicrobiales bacterium]